MSLRFSPEDRTRLQARAEAALIPHPHRLELRGSPESLVWPDVCAYCGSASGERIRVSKAFYRRSYSGRGFSGPFNYRIHTVDMPFCPPCASRHRETVARPSPFTRWRSFLLNPAHIATIGCLVLFFKIAPDAFDVAARGAEIWVAWGLPAVMALGALWTIGIVWWMTRPDRLEPRTEITEACDFSGSVVAPFEHARHLYALRNQAFATALADANRDRVWTDADQKRMWSRSAVVSVIVLGGLIIARVLLWYFTGK